MKFICKGCRKQRSATTYSHWTGRNVLDNLASIKGWNGSLEKCSKCGSCSVFIHEEPPVQEKPRKIRFKRIDKKLRRRCWEVRKAKAWSPNQRFIDVPDTKERIATFSYSQNY